MRVIAMLLVLPLFAAGCSSSAPATKSDPPNAAPPAAARTGPGNPSGGEPAVAPGATTVELLYAGARLEALRAGCRGRPFASEPLTNCLTPGSAGAAETVVIKVVVVPKAGAFEVALITVDATTAASAPRTIRLVGLAKTDGDFHKLWDVIQADAILALQQQNAAKSDAGVLPTAPAPRPKVTCRCSYCSCLDPVDPEFPGGNECRCNEERCKKAGCLCNKWVKNRGE